MLPPNLYKIVLRGFLVALGLIGMAGFGFCGLMGVVKGIKETPFGSGDSKFVYLLSGGLGLLLAYFNLRFVKWLLGRSRRPPPTDSSA